MRASSNPVCLLCRHRLATRAPRRALPWPHAAAACTYSTAPTPVPAAPNPQQDGHGSKPDAVPIRPSGVFSEKRPPKAGVTSHGNTRNRSRFSPRTKPSGDYMDALFHRIIDGQNAAPSHALGDNMSLVFDVAHLESMVDSSVPIARSYDFLKTELYPRVKQEGVHVPRIFLTAASKCMTKMIAIKKKDMWDPQLPPVADILRVCADIGEMPAQHWTMLVGKLVEKLCEPNTSQQDYESIEAYEKHLALRDAMMLDLIESWKVLSLPKNMVVDPAAEENEVVDGFWLPRLEKAGIRKFHGTFNFKAALSSLFPQYQFTDGLKAQVSTLAIATYALLLDPERSNARCRQGAARFMAMVAYVLEKVRVRSRTLRDNFTRALPLTSEYILTQWPSICATLEQDPVYRDLSANSSAASVPSARRADNEWAIAITKRLSQSYYLRNRGDVDRLWHEFFGNAKEPTAERAAQLQHHPDVFNSFINTYMALNLSDKAIGVWNTLPAVGLRPTLKTWNMMLDGCRKARNLNGLNTAWKKLVASGARLDSQIWTTRVAALIDCGDIKAGLAALQELVTEWNTAHSTGRDAVQPTIEPVNAALVGLVRQENLKGAENLIHWAAKNGLRSDVVTFNTLLRPLIRDGRENEAVALFDTMKALGIEADAATFTIILDGTLAHIPEDDTEKQLQVVNEVFEKMKASGLKTNLHTYGKMIYLLLQSGDRSSKAVIAVLSHLWRHGHELSPHIYTMLIEHYFSRRPPDLKAVDSLLRRRRLLDYDDMDRVFYERVIKGYASVGELATAFDIYRKLNDAGFMVELDTQIGLLEALVGQGRLENAKELVDRTIKWFREQHGEEWRGPQHAKFWSHAFWHMALRYGVLDRLPENDDEVRSSGKTPSSSENA